MIDTGHKVRAFKIRGVYPSHEKAEKRCEEIRKFDKYHHVFVGDLGKWLPWDDDASNAEEAVYAEFDRITERGGVLGAMETMYQRSKIQEESLYYETLKHTGEFPIIGVNTFLSSKGSPTVLPQEVIRATEEEKQYQITVVKNLNKGNSQKVENQLKLLQQKAIRNENIFEQLMEACKVCSIGQITEALFKVGGQYRRNM